MIAQANEFGSEGRAQLIDRSQPDRFVGCGVYRCAMHEDRRHVRRRHDVPRRANRFDVVHAGAHDDWFAKTGNVLDQWVVIAFTGTDFVGGYPRRLQLIGGGAGERCRQIDHPLSRDVL